MLDAIALLLSVTCFYSKYKLGNEIKIYHPWKQKTTIFPRINLTKMCRGIIEETITFTQGH